MDGDPTTKWHKELAERVQNICTGILEVADRLERFFDDPKERKTIAANLRDQVTALDGVKDQLEHRLLGTDIGLGLQQPKPRSH